ncbi:hypothetical protein [Pendulispora albinea]|uniref:Lipoprotein n=1 Tax=Pendulispora albinea TaxID=2741071 RepID=A0ABZ2LWS1_9BACT
MTAKSQTVCDLRGQACEKLHACSTEMEMFDNVPVTRAAMAFAKLAWPLAGALVLAGCSSAPGPGTYCQSGPKYGTQCYTSTGTGNPGAPLGPAPPPQERSMEPGGMR